MTEDKPLSLDDINSRLEDIARDKDHRDHFKALKMLKAAETASIVLPDPLTTEEVIDRLARVIKPCGLDAVHLAISRAFPYSKRDVRVPPPVSMDDFDEQEKKLVANVSSIPMFYAAFPELKRNGLPKGYPRGKGMVIQREWIRNKVVEIIWNRKAKEREAAIEEQRQASV